MTAHLPRGDLAAAEKKTQKKKTVCVINENKNKNKKKIKKILSPVGTIAAVNVGAILFDVEASSGK